MSTCDDCKYAIWKLSKNGALHPSKIGECTFQYKLKEIPDCMSWGFYGPPSAFKSPIKRGKEHHPRACPYLQCASPTGDA